MAGRPVPGLDEAGPGETPGRGTCLRGTRPLGAGLCRIAGAGLGAARWGLAPGRRLALLLLLLAALAAGPVLPLQAGTRGPVTNLPLPRYVSLKATEGNARRGPSTAQRIDWVFTRRGMPLQITAEYENWRRVRDRDGATGWVHYTLLSGTRTVLVEQDLVPIRSAPEDGSAEVARLQAGVVARLLECRPDWCRVSIDGYRGWLRKGAVWGVDPAETRD